MLLFLRCRCYVLLLCFRSLASGFEFVNPSVLYISLVLAQVCAAVQLGDLRTLYARPPRDPRFQLMPALKLPRTMHIIGRRTHRKVSLCGDPVMLLTTAPLYAVV